MASVMSSIIPGRRDFISSQPPDRNGQPAHKKMIEPSTGPTQSMP